MPQDSKYSETMERDSDESTKILLRPRDGLKKKKSKQFEVD